MEFLQSIDLTAYGVAAPFMAYLIYKNFSLEKKLDAAQDRIIEILGTQNKDYINSINMLNGFVDILKDKS